MSYECRVEADSVNETGDRLTTFVVTYPRMVHSELMTHRVMSRNSSSSRAIPVEKLIQQVLNDPAVPVWWGKNQSGMQAREELTGVRLQAVKEAWLGARDEAVASVKHLQSLELHKQIANRILEPWMWITVIVSATEWDNFFKLRCHPDAQPEIRYIAEMMRASMDASVPEPLSEGEWHLPFIKEADLDGCQQSQGNILLPRVSSGRCARVSYLTHDGKRDLMADADLCSKLTSSGHWSPLEHPAQATPGTNNSNFKGFTQYRKQFPGEDGIECQTGVI